MAILTSSLLALTLALAPESGLRLYNPHATAVEATVTCAGAPRAVSVGSRDTVDLDGCADATLSAAQPLVAFETVRDDGVETQRLIAVDAACPSFAVEAPLFGCKGGTATVAMPSAGGSTYSWSVEGASVLSGLGTNRLVLTLGDGPAARVSATVTGACTGTSEAVIAVRDALVIEKLEVPEIATAGVATTVRWTYAAGSVPAAQVLTGSAFDAPVILGPDARSHSWTPGVNGLLDVELRASHAQNIALEPSRRRRAVGSSRVTASDCPSARASGRIDVRGCSVIDRSIDAPATVEAGSTFSATVFMRTGETAEWVVSNATILSGATTDTVVLRAEETGKVRVRVNIVAGPECTTAADATIAVVERASCATATPTVALSVEKVSCASATIRATFTGTPPFRGTWFDGVSFETNAATLDRTFTAPATYTLRTFRDALCSGSVSSSARVASFGPTVSIATVGGTCSGVKAVATFTGTPPFAGVWSTTNEWFQTNERTLELNDVGPGILNISGFHDAACVSPQKTSNSIEIAARPEVRLRAEKSCAIGGSDEWRSLLVDITYGKPPFTIHWTDGTVTAGGTQERTIRRVVRVQQDSDFTIERVTSGGCDAVLPQIKPTVHFDFRKHVTIPLAQTRTTCVGVPKTVNVEPGMDPGVTYQWAITNGGTILSGQGTSELTYVQNALSGGELSVTATYPDGLCSSTARIEPNVARAGKVLEFSVEPATIKRGGTARVKHARDRFIESLSIAVYPTERQSSLSFPYGECVGETCWFDFKDKDGPPPGRRVGFLAMSGGPCMATLESIVYLTIEP